MAAGVDRARARGGEQQHVAVDGRAAAVERRQHGGEGARDRAPFRLHLRHVDRDDAAGRQPPRDRRGRTPRVASGAGIPSPA